jgi:hypothetical protein
MALVYSPEVPSSSSGKATPQDAPPSPTLTNPDMILPRQYTYTFSSSSPSPDRLPIASSPTLRHTDFGLPTADLSPIPDATPDPSIAIGIKMPIRQKPVAPSSQYSAFAGYEHGAPLSDIGEEETIASTTPRSRATRQSRSPSPVRPLSPEAPPTAEERETTPIGRPRSGRSSPISDGSDIGDWENFDSSKMMSGRLAADVAKQDPVDATESKRNSYIDRDEMAALNDKAEEILENARKRLTHMEDNLTKARHSMLWSPRSSPNISDYHQPAGSLYRSISLAGVNRRFSRPVINTSPAHTRGSSDTTGTTPTGLKRLSMIPEARSSSAQEFSRAQDSPLSRASPAARLQAHSPSSSQSINSPMRTLEEEDAQIESPSTSKTSPDNRAHGLGIDTGVEESRSKVSRTVTPTLVRSASVASLGRPESAASTRSIRESMSDLRLRINDLKAKANADKERRQSVQSRNTPSPFTSANPEQWYTSSPEYKQPGSPINQNAGQGWSPKHTRDNSLDAQLTPHKPVGLLEVKTPTPADPLTPTGRTDVNTPNLHRDDKAVLDAHDSVIEESQYEDAAQNMDDDQVAASEEEQIYLNEVLEESLHDVEPDVPEIPESLAAEAERHEDRLDAFDYENMFLHSAMGNYRGAQEDSESDNESVETSRADQSTPVAGQRSESEGSQGSDGEESDMDADDAIPTPTALSPPPKPWAQIRSNSSASVSTEASFATAIEGSRQGSFSDGDDDGEDDTPHEILNWGTNVGVGAFPAPPMTSPRRETVVNGYFPAALTSGATSPRHNAQRSLELQAAPDLRIVTEMQATGSGFPAPPTRSPATSLSSRSVPSQPTRSPQHGDVEAADTASEAPSDNTHPTNTEILMESLIKLADPDFKMEPGSSVTSPASSGVGVGPSLGAAGRTGGFAEVDKELVLALLREVGQVCNGVLKGEKRRDVQLVKGLRRRLDVARRVLDGDLEAD